MMLPTVRRATPGDLTDITINTHLWCGSSVNTVERTWFCCTMVGRAPTLEAASPHRVVLSMHPTPVDRGTKGTGQPSR